jgi:hypothetical protein
MRLFFGDPRLWLIGVEVLVFGDDRALRTEGIDGEAVNGIGLGLDGDVMSKNEEGFENPSIFLDFFDGELKIEGSMFSESISSNADGARRLPVVDCVCFSDGEKFGMMATSSCSVIRSSFAVSQRLTILPVFGAGESLESRSTDFGKGLARRESHFE